MAAAAAPAAPTPPEKGGFRHALGDAYRNVVSGQAELERFAGAQESKAPKAVSANDLAQMSRTAGAAVDTIAKDAMVDRKGDAIGEGIAKGAGERRGIGERRGEPGCGWKIEQCVRATRRLELPHSLFPRF